jgi:hypothetical protein
MRIVISGDVDWACEEILTDYLDLFFKNQSKITLFATHESKLLKSMKNDLVEIGIHPNHNHSLIDGKGKSSTLLIEELLRLYPQSKGVRSHSLTYSSGLLDLYKSFGFKYESNCLLPFNFNVHPWKCYSGLIRIPINWEDDVSWHFGLNKFDTSMFKNGNFYSFNFHPVHVYLNTPSHDYYQKYKKYYHSHEELLKNRYKGYGTRSYLIDLLTHIKSNKLDTFNLNELTNEY